METSDYIAIGALVVASFSAAFAMFSYFVAKASLKLSKQQHKERNRSVSPYFMEVYKWYKCEEIYISFALRFTNEATMANSIASLDLHLDYYDESGVLGRAKIGPSINVKPVNIEGGMKVMELPLALSEKSSKSGWVTFKLPEVFKEKFFVDLYKICATTTDGEVVSVDTHIVNTVHNEE